MKAVVEIWGSALWFLLCLASILLVTGTIVALLWMIRDKRGIRGEILAVANLLLSFGIFVLLMDCGHYVTVDDPDQGYGSFQYALFQLPWVFHAGAEFLSGLIFLFCRVDNLLYRKNHLTMDVIRRTMNLFPEGIVIGDPNGTVRLSNLKMDALCRQLTGGNLSDVSQYWKWIGEHGKEQNGQTLIRLPEGKAWLFTRERFVLEEKEYDQITATDVTERWRIIEELEEKNARLQDLQRRMKAVSELSRDMFMAQEEANARATLHNQLGQVLLMGRHFLNNAESTDVGIVRDATLQMNRILLGEATEPYVKEADPLTQAIAMANSIGVRVDLEDAAQGVKQTVGAIAEKIKMQNGAEMLAQAIIECAANTVKHAEGDCITVRVSEGEDGLLFAITNNGKPPKTTIFESGGLLSLRRKIEEAGGSMQVESSPAFRLSIRMKVI